MMGILDPWTYLLGTIAVVLIPGPNSLFCLSVAVQHGIAAGYRVATAYLIGNSTLMICTALGAATFLQSSPQWFMALKLVGSLYIAYLGCKLMASSLTQQRNKSNQKRPFIQRQHLFSKALALSMTNPKALLFYLSFFIQFVDPKYPNPLYSFLILAVILLSVSFAYHGILILCGRKLAQFSERHQRSSTTAIAVTGGAFIVFALKLWLTE